MNNDGKERDKTRLLATSFRWMTIGGTLTSAQVSDVMTIIHTSMDEFM